MNIQEFSNLFKDLVARLYDRTAIETHPLAVAFPVASQATSHRAEQIQNLVFAEIDQLRPDPGEPQAQSPEWRPFLILHRRYVEGQDPQAIAEALFISDRQFRRDHSRALLALTSRIWERYFQPTSPEQHGPGEGHPDDQPDFDLHAEPLDLHEVLQGVVELIAFRLKDEATRCELDLAPAPMELVTDRTLLRQVLINLINHSLRLQAKPVIHLRTIQEDHLTLSLAFAVQANWAEVLDEGLDSISFVREMGPRLPAHLEERYPPRGQAGSAEVRLVFRASPSRTILVVDDQPAALKMFQRYLSRTDLELVGVNDPAQAVSIARQTRPALIILDVMMPHMDGWEVLQAFKIDPFLREVPVIVCSAWGEPELARSLGAVTFLKKPIFQKDILEVLARLGLIEG
ncbi:MAG: response regulator [Anaerolineales bacterium]|nr:response regulator [Anaerolineales bacterium]